MAQLEFFMSNDDTRAFTAFLIELVSAEFVPEKSPVAPPFPRYTSLEQVQTRIEQDEYYSRFMVLSPQWERYPLVFNEIHANDGTHFFAVSLQYGGPAFDYFVARNYSQGELQWIRPGSFSDFPDYIVDLAYLQDHSLYRTFKRPDEMTVCFKEVQK